MARKAEIPGQGAEFRRTLDPALNVDPFDGVSFFNIVNILEEVQIQVEAIRSFHRVGQLLLRSSALTGLGLNAIGCKKSAGK